MTRVVVVASILLFSTLAFAQLPPPPPNPELEKQFRADVEAASPEAARRYDEGNVARDAMRVDDAVNAYRKASELAPKVDHPHRRLCWALATANHVDEAITACELALSLAPDSPYNESALASTLLSRNKPLDLRRGLALARHAAEVAPNDISMLAVWCHAAVQSNNMFELSTCSERLMQLAPGWAGASFFGALAAIGRSDYDEAHRLLRKAKEAGLPPAMADALIAELEKLEKDAELLPISSDEALTLGGLTFGAWLLVFILLLAVGGALSQATLRTVDDVATDAAGSGRERRLRVGYKAVLSLAGVFFYLSMPVMVVTIIAAALGVLLVFDEMGGIPIILLWFIGVTVVATIVAILRSLFVRKDNEFFGNPIDLKKYPKLRALLDEVAAAVGTRPVDVAYLAPGGDIAVLEPSSVWRALRGTRTERGLILGVAQFDGMTQLQLRSILAHEHGHFRNEDTAGGGFALAVRRSLASLDERLANAGLGGFFNPVWWFVRMFHSMYLGISQGASRLQEVLADRWAVHAYGSAALGAGLRHIAARSVEFDDHLEKTIAEVIENKWPLPNLYDHDPDSKKSEEEIAADLDKAMNSAPTAHDSHPSPRQRIEWADRLAIAREPQPDDDARVWDLFGDPEPIEREMTAIVRGRAFAQTGVRISDAEIEGDADADAEPKSSSLS